MTQQKIITIFGGTGFIGRYIVYALAKTGATIKVATRVPQRAYFLRPAGQVGQIVPIPCDVHDDASVAAALAGATHAVNLIGTIEPKRGKGSFKEMHVAVAARIAKACAAHNIDMLIHFSGLVAEKDAASCYGRSKFEGEEKVRAAFGKSVILRPALVFGPEDKFFNKFARMARFAPNLPLIGGGKRKLQPVYVGDIAEAARHIVEAPEAENFYGKTYALAGPQVYTFRQLLALILQVTRQKTGLAYLPVFMAKIIGCLPFSGLTLDQVRMMQRDSIADGSLPGLKALGVEPTSLEIVLPTYLDIYTPGGRSSENRAA